MRSGDRRPLTWLLVAGCMACAEAEPPVDDPESSADYVGQAVSTDVREGGALRARVYGDTVYTWEESHRMVLVPVVVEMFDTDGAPTGRLTADRGELNTLTQEMSATGDVVLLSIDETRRIRTERLRYDPKADRIWSDEETTMREGSVDLTGSGFEADADFTRVELFESRSESFELGPSSR